MSINKKCESTLMGANLEEENDSGSNNNDDDDQGFDLVNEEDGFNEASEGENALALPPIRMNNPSSDADQESDAVGIGTAVEAFKGEEEERKEAKAEGEEIFVLGNEEAAQVAAHPCLVSQLGTNMSNHMFCMLEQIASTNKSVSHQDVDEAKSRRHSRKEPLEKSSSKDIGCVYLIC